MGIQTDGEIFEWDNNQLPAIKVGNQKDWLTITTYGYGPDYHASAIKVDGTLWAWGNNSSGELGDGTFVAKTNPTKIGNATDWRSVSNGNRFTLAIKSDGTLWAWVIMIMVNWVMAPSLKRMYPQESVRTQIGNSFQQED